MFCEKVKLGNECFFAKNSSCSYIGGHCYAIDHKCAGCERIQGAYCKVYPQPTLRWETGNCPMATHLDREEEAKKHVDFLKASKKAAAKSAKLVRQEPVPSKSLLKKATKKKKPPKKKSKATSKGKGKKGR